LLRLSGTRGERTPAAFIIDAMSYNALPDEQDTLSSMSRSLVGHSSVILLATRVGKYTHQAGLSPVLRYRTTDIAIGSAGDQRV